MASRGHRRALSVVISNTVMIAIVLAISAGLIVWAQSSFGLFGSGSQMYYYNNEQATQERFVVEKVFFNATYQCDDLNCDGPNSHGQIILFVRNTGLEEIRIVRIYVNASVYDQFNSPPAMADWGPSSGCKSNPPAVLLPVGNVCKFSIVWQHTWPDGTFFAIVVASDRGNQARYEGSSIGPPVWETTTQNAITANQTLTTSSTSVTTTMKSNVTITNCVPTTTSTVSTGSSISTSKSTTTYTTPSTISSTTTKTTSPYTTTKTSTTTLTSYLTTLTTVTSTTTSKTTTSSTSTSKTTSTYTSTTSLTQTVTTTPDNPLELPIGLDVSVVYYVQIGPQVTMTTTSKTTTTSSQTTTSTSTFPIATTYTTTSPSTTTGTGTGSSLTTTRSTSTTTITTTFLSTKTTSTSRTTSTTTTTFLTSTTVTRTDTITPKTTSSKITSTNTGKITSFYTTTLSGTTVTCTTIITTTSVVSTVTSAIGGSAPPMFASFFDWLSYLSLLLFGLLTVSRSLGLSVTIRFDDKEE
jgi:hypothetical protein